MAYRLGGSSKPLGPVVGYSSKWLVVVGCLGRVTPLGELVGLRTAKDRSENKVLWGNLLGLGRLDLV